MDNSTIPGVLACDCGNSRIAFAHVRGDTVAGRQTFPAEAPKKAAQAAAQLWNSMGEPRQFVAAAVNPPALEAFAREIQSAIGIFPQIVGGDLPLPIETALEHPESVGVDRLCCAAAAFDQLGTACTVADFGTAITIDCVNEQGVFLGGVILPGLRTGAAALHRAAELLPEVQLENPTWVFGTDTHQAIVGGLVYGARGALRERVEAYANELGVWPTVILTGGDAHWVCPQPGADGLVQAVVEDLCLRGVAMAYYRTLLK